MRNLYNVTSGHESINKRSTTVSSTVTTCISRCIIGTFQPTSYGDNILAKVRCPFVHKLKLHDKHYTAVNLIPSSYYYYYNGTAGTVPYFFRMHFGENL